MQDSKKNTLVPPRLRGGSKYLIKMKGEGEGIEGMK